MGSSSSRELKALYLGIDSAGKTSFLYRACLGESVFTIPTIGFNTETVQIHTSDDARKTCSLTMWEVGGCSKIRPLMRHYTENLSCLLFFFDTTREVDEFSMKKFSHIAEKKNIKLRYESTVDLIEFMEEEWMRSLHVPVVILFSKQDLPNSLPSSKCPEEIEFIKRTFRECGNTCPIGVFDVETTNGMGIQEAFSWIADVAYGLIPLEESNDGSSSHPESSSQSLEVADRHERWTKVEIPAVPADELSDDEFLERFGSATLPDWSHKTHLRIAFLFLIRYGRQKGKNRIFDGIRNFIEHSDLARGKTFHLTLTYFWIQMMHLAVASDPLVNRTMEENVERLVAEEPPQYAHPDSRELFHHILTENSHLLDFWVFLHFYTKEAMLNSPDSRLEFVPPDIQPLPTFVPRKDSPPSWLANNKN